jgi:hypothetical protein
MNVEIGAEAALFPGKEYIKGIFVAVHIPRARVLTQKGTGVFSGLNTKPDTDNQIPVRVSK